MFHVWGKMQLLSKQVLPTFLPPAKYLAFQKRMYVWIPWQRNNIKIISELQAIHKKLTYFPKP
jgi:hypothetical protein